jgi:hypothetical protein
VRNKAHHVAQGFS